MVARLPWRWHQPSRAPSCLLRCTRVQSSSGSLHSRLCVCARARSLPPSLLLPSSSSSLYEPRLRGLFLISVNGTRVRCVYYPIFTLCGGSVRFNRGTVSTGRARACRLLLIPACARAGVLLSACSLSGWVTKLLRFTELTEFITGKIPPIPLIHCVKVEVQGPEVVFFVVFF